jgi:integral membrane sensor domain MASE1
MVYFAANTSGTLVVAPVILLLASKRLGWPAATWKTNMQAAAMSSVTIALAWLAFSGILPADWKTDVLAYLPFPFLVGVALAYGVPLAALTNLAVVTIAMAATLSGQGPFADASALVSFGQIELFISILTGRRKSSGSKRRSIRTSSSIAWGRSIRSLAPIRKPRATASCIFRGCCATHSIPRKNL